METNHTRESWNKGKLVGQKPPGGRRAERHPSGAVRLIRIV